MKVKFKIVIALFVLGIILQSVSVMAQESVKEGEYAIDVELKGGSGKAYVNTPTLLQIKDGKTYVEITWSSPYYDYMIVEGQKYENLADGEMNSHFVIPISVYDEPVSVIADTTAMGTPHEIEYELTFYSDSITSKDNLPQEEAKKVIYIAVGIIVVGGILNHFVKKRSGR